MNIVIALLIAIVIITVLSAIASLGLAIVFAITMFIADPTIVTKWGNWQQYLEEKRKQPKLAESIELLNLLGYWYINIPMWLYNRFVKKMKNATPYNPRGLK